MPLSLSFHLASAIFWCSLQLRLLFEYFCIVHRPSVPIISHGLFQAVSSCSRYAFCQCLSLFCIRHLLFLTNRVLVMLIARGCILIWSMSDCRSPRTSDTSCQVWTSRLFSGRPHGNLRAGKRSCRCQHSWYLRPIWSIFRYFWSHTNQSLSSAPSSLSWGKSICHNFHSYWTSAHGDQQFSYLKRTISCLDNDQN